MASRTEHLVRRLAEEGVRIEAFFRDLPASRMDETIYTAGAGWDTRQVLAHLCTSEEAFGRLIADVISGGPGAPEDFDLNAYNERKAAGLSHHSVAELLALFSEQRSNTVERVAALGDADLDKRGRHPFLGLASVEEMLKLIYRHNQIHVREIRRALDEQAV